MTDTPSRLAGNEPISTAQLLRHPPCATLMHNNTVSAEPNDSESAVERVCHLPANPRESIPQLTRCGKFFWIAWEYFWTRWMGLPRVGEEVLFNSSPAFETGLTIMRLLLGPALTIGVFRILMMSRIQGFLSPLQIVSLPALIWLFLVGLAITVGGARKWLTTLMHQAVHDECYCAQWANEWICYIGSALLLLQDREGYQRDHNRHHKIGILAKLVDVDCRFLVEVCGIRPGLGAERDYWIALVLALISPRVHWAIVWGRIRSNFMNPEVPHWRRLLAAAVQLTVITPFVIASLATGSLIPLIYYAVGWFVPVYILYTPAAIGMFFCLHGWLRQPRNGETTTEYFERLVCNRFVGTRWPAFNESASAFQVGWKRLCWIIRTTTIDLIIRVAVLPGTLCVHGYHHRRINGPKKWTAEIYHSASAIRQGELRVPSFWGLHAAGQDVFRSLAELPPLRFPPPLDANAISAVLDDM